LPEIEALLGEFADDPGLEDGAALRVQRQCRRIREGVPSERRVAGLAQAGVQVVDFSGFRLVPERVRTKNGVGFCSGNRG